MEFRILGPLEVLEGGRPIDVGAPKQRSVLARLLISANTVVSTDRILEDLWPEGPPKGGPRSLHVHVARLRRALEVPGRDASIVTRAPGYVLEVDRDAVDAMKFERLWRDARANLETNPRHAAATLRRALGLWRGPALADFTYDPFAETEIRRLDEIHFAAVEDLIEAELALGNHAEVVARLEQLITEHPLRERLWGQLMVALYQGGRQAEALRAFQAARSSVVEAVGAEPSQELQDLEERILLHDTTLLAPETAPGVTPDLPLRLSSFVGRWKDQATVRRLLDEHRLVTVTGVGGVGKTSFAIETAREAAADYADGVWLVPLDGLELARLVPDEIARILGRRVVGRQGAIETLREFLVARQTLLILDNCEHLIGGVATTVNELLRACPELHILATSRERLGVDGEVVHALPPLTVPPAAAIDIEELRVSAAVQLFVDRASSSRSGFTLDDDNRAFIAHICRSVAGIPLAIELAAARLLSMSLKELAGHMDDQLGILTDGQRTALPRHRTLRETMDWSYSLLAEGDQALLRRMCVFRGEFSLDDAVAVCGDGNAPESGVLDGISRLVTASLVLAEGRNDVTKYRTLEPVRQYGVEQRRKAGEDHAVRFRHATWYAAKAGTVSERSEAGRLDRVLEIGRSHREDFREALRWSLETDESTLSLVLASRLAPFWSAAGSTAEGYAWLEAALSSSPKAASAERFSALSYDIQLGIAANEPVGPRLDELDRLASTLPGNHPQARAAYLRGVYAWSRGDLAAAVDLLEESCRLSERGDGRPSRSRVLLTECLIRIGRLEDAERLLEELDAWNQQQGRSRDYWLVENLGMIAYVRGDLADAERFLEEATMGFGSLRSRMGQMEAMSYMAWITIDLGKERRTRLLAEQALTIAREDGEVMIEANCLWLLARLALRRGDTLEARSLLRECVHVGRRRDERIVLVLALHVCADLVYTEGDADRALRLFGAADRHLRAIPHILPPSVTEGYDRALADLRETLGGAGLEAARNEGSAMTLDDALDLALGPVGVLDQQS
ncbi:Transcriptional regulator, AfsR family [hydrothermal vent metagenome]|uniref:Transcriptional regulator, AfsR family n=1 Tax=hydrothermal vent metagenome TaxID=652676 RepID=A0A3B0RJJ0_9ZZZZ